jgi:hypothetical protein
VAGLDATGFSHHAEPLLRAALVQSSGVSGTGVLQRAVRLLDRWEAEVVRAQGLAVEVGAEVEVEVGVIVRPSGPVPAGV